MTGHAQSYPQRTDVPTVYIETENRSSITSKEEYINCTFIYVDGDSLARYENTQIRGMIRNALTYDLGRFMGPRLADLSP